MKRHHFFAVVAVLLLACRPALPASVTDTAAPLRPHSGEPAKAEEEIRTVAAGSVDTLELSFAPGTPRIAKPEVIAAWPTRNGKLRLAPLKKGVSSVEVTDAEGAVRRKIVYNVITNDLSAKVAELRQLLGEARGLEVASVNDKIVVDGTVTSGREAKRLAKLAKAYPELLNLAESSDEACSLCAASCGPKKRAKP